MVAGGISKTGVTLSIPSIVQAGGTAVLGESNGYKFSSKNEKI